MDRSTLLAKLIGPPFLAVGLGLLLNQKTYWDMIDEVIRHPSPIGNLLIYLSGLLSMVAGLAMVNVHPSWTRDWRVVITILGWLCVIGGVLRIVFPSFVGSIGASMLTSTSNSWIIGEGVVFLALGAWLSFMGYGGKSAGSKRKR